MVFVSEGVSRIIDPVSFMVFAIFGFGLLFRLSKWMVDETVEYHVRHQREERSYSPEVEALLIDYLDSITGAEKPKRKKKHDDSKYIETTDGDYLYVEEANE